MHWDSFKQDNYITVGGFGLVLCYLMAPGLSKGHSVSCMSRVCVGIYGLTYSLYHHRGDSERGRGM